MNTIIDLTRAHVCMVINEQSHGGAEAYRALDLLQARGARVSVTPASLTHQVMATDLDGACAVIAAGGDGTVRSTAKLARRLDLPMAVLPLGTANDFARNLGLPTAVEAAVESFAHLRPWRIPVGIVNDEPFLNAATVGWSVAAAKTREPEAKRRWGILTYARSMFVTWQRHPVFRAQLTTEHGESSHELMQVIVGKGRFYGGGVQVHDTAAVTYPRFEVMAIPRLSAGRVLELLPDLLRGHLYDHPRVLHFTTRSLELTADPPQDISLDGEVITRTPAHFWVDGVGLKILVPGAEAARDAIIRSPGEASLDALRALLLEQEHTLEVLARAPLQEELRREIERERELRRIWARALQRVLRRTHTWVTAPDEEHEAPRALGARALRRLGHEAGAYWVMQRLSHELAQRAAQTMEDARAGRPLLAKIHRHARDHLREGEAA